MPIKNQCGFSMLEVLISILVIMIGVLGIAGMQMLAINNSENARYEGQAAILASGLAAEMQANPGFWATAATPASVTVTGSTITGVGAGGTCLSTPCSAAQMAYYDLQNFGTAMAGVANLDGVTYNGTALPSGSGAISCTLATVSTPAICTITLTWLEKNTALSNDAGSAGQLQNATAQAHTYQTLVSIQP